MNNRYEQFFKKQHDLSLLRTLNTISSSNENQITIKNKKYIDFSSNDYLSLSDHEYLKMKSKEFIDKYGTSGKASRLLSGSYEYHSMLEEKVAQLKKKEAGLIFGNGFIANTSMIPALVQRDDVIFADKLVHASIIDGIFLAKCKYFRFEHNNIEHLKKLLEEQRNKFNQVFIITESVFSMDGDIAPLKELVILKNQYKALLYIDEAHATGVFGITGSGIAEQLGISDDIDVIMGTFGKALGSYGAYAALSNVLKQYFINKARGFIYSTALPPGVIGASLAAIELLEKEPFRRQELLKNCKYFRQELKDHGIIVLGDSQIIPVILNDTEKTVVISEKLKEHGFYILPIRPPTVPEGSARLRLSIVYNHSEDILNKLLEILLNLF